MTSPLHVVLPDELVKEILSPLLKLPDELFRDTTYKSPFATPALSCSAVLAVCKQWMRVATPLLYHIVVLRSKAQAQALECSLKDNSELGTHVRKLRVEGGFGRSMEKIIFASPNITDFCLSFDLLSSESVSGLVKGMYSMSPSRVILREASSTPVRENACTRALATTLCYCITNQWTNLKTFHYPYDEFRGTYSRAQEVAHALSLSPSLETIHVSSLCSTDLLELSSRGTKMQHIYVEPLPKQLDEWVDFLSLRRDDPDFVMPTMEDIQVELELVDLEAIRAGIAADPRLRSLVIYKEADTDEFIPNIPPPPNPSYTPMENASDEVKEEIWKRVIGLAAWSEIPSVKKRGCLVYDHVVQSNPYPMRLNIASVNKQFRRITEPYLYKDLMLTHFNAITIFARILTAKPHLAHHIRTLTFALEYSQGELRARDSTSRGQKYLRDHESQRRTEAVNALLKILPLVANLEVLKQVVLGGFDCSEDDVHLPWDVIMHLVRSGAARKITELSGLLVELPQTNELLREFAALSGLKELGIHCLIKDVRKEDGSLMYDEQPIPVNLFPKESFANLVKLSYDEEGVITGIRFIRVGDFKKVKKVSLLEVLADVELPSLRELNICSKLSEKEILPSFISKHGSKLEHLTMPTSQRNEEDVSPFQQCRNLKTLTCFMQTLKPPEIDFFSVPPATAGEDIPPMPLEKISFTFKDGILLEPVENGKETWVTFFESVDFSAFLSLKEIQVIGCKWPVSEREVKSGKNHWIRAAEVLLRRFEIRMTDAEGNRWIPRLSAANTKKTKKAH